MKDRHDCYNVTAGTKFRTLNELISSFVAVTKTSEKAIKELVEGTVLNDGEVRVGEFLNWS